MKLPIILALDTKDIAMASSIITESIESINHFKIGLEFFLSNGSDGVKKLRAVGEEAGRARGACGGSGSRDPRSLP